MREASDGIWLLASMIDNGRPFPGPPLVRTQGDLLWGRGRAGCAAGAPREREGSGFTPVEEATPVGWGYMGVKAGRWPRPKHTEA